MKAKKLLLLFVLAVTLLCLSSCEESRPETPQDAPLTDVKPDDISVSLPSGEVSVQRHDGKLILVLPSGRDGAKWSFDGTVLINGKTVKGGDPVEVHTGDVSFENASGTETLTVRCLEALPSLHITLEDGEFAKVNGSPDHSYKASGTVALTDSEGRSVYSGGISVRGRGNSTWAGAAKKPYQIEFSEKLSLFGLAESKKYVLLANYYDRSLLRNTVAMSLADLVFNGYSPASTPVDLFVDGSFIGSYLLCEKIDIGSSRIDITDMEKLTEDSFGGKIEGVTLKGDTEGAAPGSYKYFDIPEEHVPANITGGYLLEFDFAERYPDEDCGFVTSRGIPVVIKAPEHPSKAQVEYIREYVCDFEDAIYSEDGKNSKGKHYSEYADTDSLAVRYLFEEYMLNIDGGLSSFYIYKDKGDGKMVFSCVWDYDCTLGNYNLHADLTDPDILFISELETRNDGQSANWFYGLMQKEDFRELVAEAYPKFRDAVSKLISQLQSEAEKISASASADELLYGNIEARNKYKADSGRNFDEAFAYLEDFMKKRIAFFDETFGK